MQSKALGRSVSNVPPKLPLPKISSVDNAEYYNFDKNCIDIYSQFYNVLRLFDILPNFSFSTSETMHDYCL